VASALAQEAKDGKQESEEKSKEKKWVMRAVEYV
jgi:hypothetical protein